MHVPTPKSHALSQTSEAMANSSQTSVRWKEFEEQHKPANGTRSPRHGRAYDDMDLDELHRHCVHIGVHRAKVDEKETECEELYERGNRYKEKYQDALKERDDLEARLVEASKASKNNNKGRTSASGSAVPELVVAQLQKDNQFLHKQYLTSLNFLSNFGATDFQQIVTEWHKMQDELAKTQGQLTRLQKEVLSAVDRFDPNYDSHLANKFTALNKSIGLLTKSKDLRSLKFLADPVGTWDPSVFWPNSLTPSLKGAAGTKLTDGEKRLLFRQAIWKFLSDRLFVRSKPFNSYGGEVGDIASNLPFEQLYPDHLTSTSAGKWRSLTTRALASHPSDAAGKQSLIASLSLSFASFIHSSLLLPPTTSKEGSRAGAGFEEIQALTEKGKDLPKRLSATLSEAIELSRLLMGERAGFEVRVPSLEGGAGASASKDGGHGGARFRKEEDDGEMTVLGANVGVVDGPDVETEVGGEVKLVGSPILVKFGNGGGQNLEEELVLVKGFVVLV
ncbi:hypothetical protein QBC42DRAFT_269489 [Cladorrhinum samala]|uniref:Uncharacterized protein n=1 Tax=Cladorrhinum samala TaxID=585594 RepID=A0AAV9HN17_9PEZI|nr:hypothetical protein QBC42DRAFT_269489 [Cladorrhinum samala]